LDVTADETLFAQDAALAGVSYRYQAGNVIHQFESDTKGRAESLSVEQILSISKENLKEDQLKKVLDYNEKMRGLEIQQKTNNHWLASNYAFLARSFRSFALFLALEAIAWFLLRQYRFAITDFKQLFRMHAKRQGYYLAFKVSQAGGPGADAAVIAVAASMLQEDLSGRLAKDQTTEDFMERTLVESNPITDLWSKLVDRLTPSKPTAANNEGSG
jgi:hypothetical protein